MIGSRLTRDVRSRQWCAAPHKIAFMRQRRLILWLSLLSYLFVSSRALTSPTTPDKMLRVRVVSYNLLSSHLARPSHFTTYPEADLKASNRLPIVLKKLEEEMKAQKNAVLCLQEVSYDWTGALHTFFANRGYHLVSGLYGKHWNGYMGVCLALPLETFEVVHVDISRLADEREGGWPARDDPSTLDRIWSKVNAVVDKTRKLAGYKVPEVIDHWNMSQYRFNVLISAVLREKETGNAFCVGNYHMPCAYYAPMVMTIHADLAARQVQRIAAEHGNMPYILAGDFNIKPSESVYKLLTTGEMDPEDRFFPTPKNGVEWTATASPMKSAYAETEDGEPNFTNYARVKEQEPFIDVLDYLFLSKEWKVHDVLKIPHRDTYKQLPNLELEEPSDHVMIAATLEAEL